MWPWDHVALGYLLFASIRYVRGWPKPTAGVTAVVVIGSQLPDLIDKSLAWSLEVFSTGIAFGHSLWFLGMLAVLTGAAGVRYGRRSLPAALTIGVCSHLIGDVVFAVAVGSAMTYELVLWPIVTASPDPQVGMIASILFNWHEFLAFLHRPRGRWYLLAEVGLLLVAIGVWSRDGAPGFTELCRFLKDGFRFCHG